MTDDSRRRSADPDPAGRWSPSTTRPASRSWSAACTRPASRSSPPAARPRGSRALGVPVTKVEDLTGFPECLDGRVKTLHPRVHAGILADRRLDVPRRSSSPSSASSRSTCVVSNLYPFRQTVALRRDARRVRRADRHRRAVDGPRRGQEPPVGRDRHLARRGTPTCSPRSAAGGFTLGAAPAAGRRGVRAHRDVRRRGRVAGWAACSTDTADGHGLPGLGRRDVGQGRRCCATARTRTSRPRSTPTARRRRAGRRPSSCTARRCPTTTTSTPTPPGGRRTTSTEPAVAIIKHANPCGIAVGADVAEAHRKAHACDPVSAFGGVIAVNRPVSVAMAEQVAEIFTEVIVAPAYDDGAVEVLQRKKNIRILRVRRPTAAARRRVPADLRRAADAAAPTASTPTGDDPATWTLADRRGGRRRAYAGRPGLRLAGLPRGEVQRDPARQRRRLGRRRHGPGQPGRLVPARGRRGRGSGPRARWPPPTRSSRSRTARRS